MQFHLNGFRAGDPHVHEAAAGLPDGMPDEVDVLIVGCGPAGLTLASQLSAFPSINTRILERKSGPLRRGQADGIACRTMEMFEALGFSERILKEAYWVNETTFWQPAEANPDHIARSGRIQDTEDGLSEFPHVILNQARVHDCCLDLMWNSPRRLRPDYACEVLDLSVDPGEDIPVTVRFLRNGEIESVQARYVVGCDGARSVVRASMGRTLTGDSANQSWGVMDVLAVTDFPDIRFKGVVRSARDGNIVIIPREGGYMVRLYIEMDRLSETERIADRTVTLDDLIAAARRIFRPYTLDVKEVAWWSVYEIGQRICDRFDDSSDVAHEMATPRVFIAGDACHTHSPKAGQGMNVALADAFNLGWKLAAVIQGQASPRLLDTYSAERQRVAAELIEFDRHWARRFSERPKTASRDEGGSLDPREFQDYFTRFGRYTAGTAIRYMPSLITSEARHQSLAEGLTVGMRFHSAPVVRLADAKPVHLGHTVKADGRWRLFAFADSGDPTLPSSRLAALCDFLAESPESPVRVYTPAGADIDSIIDVRAVLQWGHRDMSIVDMHPFLVPRKGRLGLQDREKVFCPDLKGGDDIFAMRRIDRNRGCVVIVRPDQYVAEVLPLDAYHDLAGFFGRIMEPVNVNRSP
ncbi:MAG: FAD-binding monooxygenase [Paracoccaceae bacterium]|nr:FAD-binding monooxygenase [Paracoccaceae bacterium]